MIQKPSTCYQCSLYNKPSGFIEPSGPVDAEVLLLGEAGGWEEQRVGQPFVGPSGGKLNSLLRKAGIDRDKCRVHNILSCSPPNNELRGAPYEQAAIRHCSQYLEPVLREGHRVAVALGSIAAKTLLPPEFKKAKANDLHGTVNWIPRGDSGFYLVPTFHPSYLLRGNQKLTGVVSFDLLKAKSILNNQWKPQPASLRIDPSLEWFSRWIDKFQSTCENASSEQAPWLAVDVETVEKLEGGKSEDELEGLSNQIVRINFSYHPDEGITVPWTGPYIDLSLRLLALRPSWHIYHNHRYDVPLLREAGARIDRLHDTMNMWKVLQSDLPMGLGFIAPFYSGYGAWKHLNDLDASKYAAIDGVQTIRIAFGISRDLQASGQWDSYMRHVHGLDSIVLHPAEEVGLKLDRAKLAAFKAKLEVSEAELDEKIKVLVGEDARPWIGERKKPAEGYFEREVEKDILVCTECSAEDVTAKHICESIKLARKLAKANVRAMAKAAKAMERANKPKAPRKRKAVVDATDSIPLGDPRGLSDESNKDNSGLEST